MSTKAWSTKTERCFHPNRARRVRVGPSSCSARPCSATTNRTRPAAGSAWRSRSAATSVKVRLWSDMVLSISKFRGKYIISESGGPSNCVFFLFTKIHKDIWTPCKLFNIRDRLSIDRFIEYKLNKMDPLRPLTFCKKFQPWNLIYTQLINRIAIY